MNRGAALGQAQLPPTNQTKMATKTIVAKYTLYSRFEIPADATEWSIHWDRITYTTAEGVEIEEQEPTMDCKDDHEAYHRPDECFSESEDEDEETDAPNVLPPKKCHGCAEPSPCGNYDPDRRWYCEECYCEEEEEKESSS